MRAGDGMENVPCWEERKGGVRGGGDSLYMMSEIIPLLFSDTMSHECFCAYFVMGNEELGWLLSKYTGVDDLIRFLASFLAWI